MAVDAERDRGRAVTEPAADRQDVHATRNQHRRMSVPQRVLWSDRRLPGQFHHSREYDNVLWSDGWLPGPDDDEPAGFPALRRQPRWLWRLLMLPYLTLALALVAATPVYAQQKMRWVTSLPPVEHDKPYMGELTIRRTATEEDMRAACPKAAFNHRALACSRVLKDRCEV